jgi:pimeloyl-ACP methyl ester carboxylesterase
MSFAPGTTGVGDSCASSLEEPMVRNLGDYEAQYLAYASQGMAVVATDYEGMRDPNLLHHYMVGLLEGRAMLDATRAARQVTGLTQIARDPIFLGGYSQGGQAALWADQIDRSYAPDVRVSGVVALAPVSSVLQTWQAILHGSDIDWFGPYVLASYGDYYKNLNVDEILLPKWTTNLLADVTSHCIDSAPKFYGANPAAVYTPQFLSALETGDLADNGYAALADDMTANNITEATSTPKLLLQNLGDTTILSSQTSAMNTQLCQMGSGHVQTDTFPGGTHYTMPVSGFTTALDWMTNIKDGKTPPTDCPK